ncbi:MAG: Lrp/AsnC family transcriptional regulator [Nanoarchaeota archaeon]
MKLDKYDWKILNELDKNSRQSDADIGRKVRLSKQVVNYRIKRLQNEQIILSFFTHINTTKLGYAIHKVYIQYARINQEKEKEILDFLNRQPDVIWAVTCNGACDLMFGIASKKIEDFDSALTRFMDKFSEYIAHRDISVFNKAQLHHRKWLMNDKNITAWPLGGLLEENILDKIDNIIINCLAQDARMPLTSIAKAAKTSSPLILQRLRKLEKKGIIEGYRLNINREKLGITYCKAFIYYDHKTSEKERRLISYSSLLPEIVGISQSIGPWDLELELEVRDNRRLFAILKEIKNTHEIVRNIQTCTIEKESGLSFIPNKISPADM